MRVLSVLALVFSLTCAGALHAKKSKRTITLDVQNADVHNVLRLISDVGRINIVTDESVSGKVTLKLRNVHWKDAFNIVLKTKGLMSERHAKNLYRVAPRDVIVKERAQKAQLYQDTQKLAPLRTKVFTLSYAKASEVSEHFKKLLTPRGSVSFDERTNKVFVKDVVGAPVFTLRP